MAIILLKTVFGVSKKSLTKVQPDGRCFIGHWDETVKVPVEVRYLENPYNFWKNRPIFPKKQFIPSFLQFSNSFWSSVKVVLLSQARSCQLCPTESLEWIGDLLKHHLPKPSISMKTLMTFALACALGLAPNANATTLAAGNETSTYVVSEKMAIWLTNDGKLKLAFDRQEGSANVEIRTQSQKLYHDVIGLKNGAQQTLDLSELGTGTYEVRVKVGKQVITKMVVIGQVSERSFRLN